MRADRHGGEGFDDLDDILAVIAFHRWENEIPEAWIYRDGELVELTAGPVIMGVQDLNDFGEIPLYVNYGYPHTDIHLLRRIRTGDVDFDGDRWSSRFRRECGIYALLLRSAERDVLRG